MIFSIGAAIAVKPTIASVGAGRTFNVSMNNLSTQKTPVAGWNMWGNDVEANTLLTDAGAASTVKLRKDPGSFYFDETEPYGWNEDTTLINKPPNFPEVWKYATSILCFKGSQSVLKYTLEGLDNSKIYGITTANGLDYPDNSSQTAISFDNGVTWISMGVPDAGKKICWAYNEVAPVSGVIAFWLRATQTGDGYTGINAMQFKEL